MEDFEKFCESVYYLSHFKEEKYYPYLRDIMPYILQNKDFSEEEISSINRSIIESDRNAKNYDDYFEQESIYDFQSKTKAASLELIERCSRSGKSISIRNQHLIISFIDDYLRQLMELRKQKVLNFK